MQLIDVDILNQWIENIERANRRRLIIGLKPKALKVADVRYMVNKIPCVDAVPVVRCKDCKHYEVHKPKVLENCERNGYLIPMSPDDFCSYGERRTNG